MKIFPSTSQLDDEEKMRVFFPRFFLSTCENIFSFELIWREFENEKINFPFSHFRAKISFTVSLYGGIELWRFEMLN